jgi:hypothetical protein
MIKMRATDARFVAIRTSREEEKDAIHFDTVFGKLMYAEKLEDEVHPEFRWKLLAKVMTTTFAEFSHEKPGIIPQAVVQLTPALQKAFQRCEER